MNKKEYFSTAGIKGRYQQAVAEGVANALTLFCEQEPEFEQSVEQSGKTFQECLDEICKGIGKSISDLEIYRRAVKFYFSVAEVHFNMSIDLCGNNGHNPPPITQTEHKRELNITLDGLLDF